MSNPSLYLQKDELNESWVDLDHFKNSSSSSESSSNGQGSPKSAIHQSGLYTPLNIEKLLQDAQRESEQNSRETSARTSPKGLRSPIELTTQEENVMGTDWMWDWSSGPERNQSSELAMKLRNASKKRTGYTLRNKSIMRNSWISKENIVTLVASYMSVFILGGVVGGVVTYMIVRKSGSQVAR